MALAATTVWEVRTTGNALNGGGFNPSRDAVNGVDYSQQDTAQLSPTDLYRVAANSLYSDSFTFTHAMEGNIIYIASGDHFTAGYYEIVTYVDATHVTLDRDPASEDTSAHKNGVGKVGGAALTINSVCAVAVTGNKCYIASGTYGETVAQANMSTLIGYITNRTTIPTGTDRPYIDGANTRTNCVTGASGRWFNIRVGRATSHGVTTTASLYLFGANVSSSNNGGTGFSFTENGGNMTLCGTFEANNNTSYGMSGVNNPDGNLFMWNYCHDNGAAGQNWRRAGSCFFCIFDSNSGSGVNGGAYSGPKYVGNIFYNNTGATSDGLNTADGQTTQLAVNNISVSNGRYGFNISTIYLFDYNCYNANGTSGLNGITAGTHDITSSPSFTDAANGDFTLQTGSPCLNTGFPQTPMVGATI